jgi:hypothetical protein
LPKYDAKGLDIMARGFTSSEPTSSHIQLIDRGARRIKLEIGNVLASFPLNPIPDELYETLADLADWKDQYSSLTEKITHDTVHKPFFCTWNQYEPFPSNVASKLVRLSLTDSAISEKIDEIEGKILSLQGIPWEESAESRADIYKNLFRDDSFVDRFRLGAIEMYGHNTYWNILRDPRVSVSFTWRIPQEIPLNISFQLDCVVEIARQGDPFFRYMRTIHYLLSSRFPELGPEDYPCAYKLYVSNVKMKTLKDPEGFST